MDTKELEEVLLPSRTYQVTHGRIVGFVDNLEAMEQAVDKTLQTARAEYLTYSDQYGHDLDDLIGKDLDYAKHDFGRIITEALLADERVLEVDVSDLTVVDHESLKAYIEVSTIFGNINAESEVKI